MPSNAPDGKGASASNGGMGEVQGMDDQDQAAISDAGLASEVSADAQASKDNLKSLAFNILGAITGIPSFAMAIGNYALGDKTSAAKAGAAAFGLGPLGSTVAGIAAADSPEDAVASTVGGMFGGVVGGVANNVAGPVGGMLAGKATKDAIGDAISNGTSTDTSVANNGMADNGMANDNGNITAKLTTAPQQPQWAQYQPVTYDYQQQPYGMLQTNNIG